MKAQTPTQEPNRVRLKKGDRAPFNGQLLSDSQFAKVIADHKAIVAKLEAKIAHLEKTYETSIHAEQASCIVKINAIEHKLKICKDTAKVTNQIYTKAIDRTADSCSRKWYESPYLHFALGAVTFGGISYGISQATK